MNNYRILITSIFLHPGGEVDRRLRAEGCETIYKPLLAPRGEDELIDLLRGVDGVIVSSDPFTARVLEASPQMRVISRTGVGYDAIDVIRDVQFAEAHHVAFVPLEELLRESDFVSLHTFLNDKTRHLINAESLSLMKPTAFLINTARGGIVDTEALCRALTEKRIAGAALDVFEGEPLRADSPLRALENVYLSPHVGGATADARRLSGAMAAENLICALKGERPPGILNPDVLAR